MADQAIRGSISILQSALSSAPDDPKVLGNLGNALLALGELKKAYLEALMVCTVWFTHSHMHCLVYISKTALFVCSP